VGGREQERTEIQTTILIEKNNKSNIKPLNILLKTKCRRTSMSGTKKSTDNLPA
jgi:hypothetical protein